MRSKSGKSDIDGAAAPHAGPAPLAEHDAAGQTQANTAARSADGGSSVLLRQAAEDRTSRRHMLRRGGTVAVATVAGLTLLDQRRAEAATGGNFILGSANDANVTTELHPTTAGQTLRPLFHLNGSALSSTSTTAIIDGPGGLQGVGLVVNGGVAPGTGLVANASSTPTTTGLAIAGSGSGTATGVSGTSGSGTGVSGFSGTGVAVEGTIANTSSSANAVSGNTAGTGAGIRGTGTRGGDFTGKAAAIRLRPASVSTHPASGKTGDLFVTSAGSLFYCKGGTTWVQLA